MRNDFERIQLLEEFPEIIFHSVDGWQVNLEDVHVSHASVRSALDAALDHFDKHPGHRQELKTEAHRWSDL